MTRDQILQIFADHGLSGISEDTALAVADAIEDAYEEELLLTAGRVVNVIDACRRDGGKINDVLTQLEKEIQ